MGLVVFVLGIIHKILEIYLLILVIRAVVSFIERYLNFGINQGFKNILNKLTDPVLDRCRYHLNFSGAFIDLSFIIAYFLIKTIQYIIVMLIRIIL